MKKIVRKIFLICLAIIAIAGLILGLVYSRYLYHLPDQLEKKIPSSVSVEDPDFVKAIKKARKFTKKLVHDWKLPSISVAVGKNGHLVWVESFGFADVDQKTPVTPEMQYRIHSLCKPLTAMAFANLWEQEAVDLNLPIEKYLPEFPQKKYEFNLRQLLSHQAGIRHYNGDEEIINKIQYPNIDSSLAIFKNDSLLFEPGTSFHYSSFGYNLAGAIMERITGKPYLDYMKDAVFDRLKMTHTGKEKDQMPEQDKIKYYEMDSNGISHIAPYIDLSLKYPSGGLVSTPEDLVRFAMAVLNGDFVEHSTFQFFTNRQYTNDGTATNYGLGWELSNPSKMWKRRAEKLSGFLGFYLPHTIGLTPMIYHMGGSIGGMSLLVIYPEYNLVFAFTSNINGELPPVYKLPMMAIEGFF